MQKNFIVSQGRGGAGEAEEAEEAEEEIISHTELQSKIVGV